MAIQYDLVPHPLSKDTNLLRAQFLSKGTIHTGQLVKWLVQTGGYNAGQVAGVLGSLTDAVLDFLEDGYDVQLGELGYLSVSLTSRQVQTRHELRAGSVQFKKLNFRTSKQARKRLLFAQTERAVKPVKRSSGLPRDKRIERLKEYLEIHTCITRGDYAHITGLLRGKAILDLNAFLEEGWLRKYGSGKTIVYLLNK